MTLSIFICEDDIAQRKFMERTVTEYINQKNYDIKLAFSTGSPMELLRYLDTHPKLNNLYLFDVNLQDEMNGIALAQKIRERDLAGKIVFITSHSELSYLAFRSRIEALDYITKGDPENVAREVRECIEVAYHRRNEILSEKEYFQVKSSTGIQKIPIEDIMFFMTSHVPHRLILCTQNDRIEFRSSLKDVINVSPDFFPCHKAYVVNTKNIKSVQRIGKARAEAEMINGTIVPVSATNIAALTKIVMG